MTKKEINVQVTRRRTQEVLLKASIKDCDRLFRKFKDKDYLNLKKIYKTELIRVKKNKRKFIISDGAINHESIKNEK